MQKHPSAKTPRSPASSKKESTEEFCAPAKFSDLPNLEKIEAGELRTSKDELNLIEYPWIALWKCEDASTVISHEWEVPHPTIPNKLVRALWRVAGDPELGLPTASDLRVYLVLMELTRDQGTAQVVYFTRWELLKRLGWPAEKQRYDALRRAFRRLKGVTISAENAFRDGRTKALKDVEFSIIDNVEIVAARGGRKPKNRVDRPIGQDLDLPLSFFRWNDVIFNSLNTGYLATIDLDFALSLRNDVALSLYRLLSKKKYGGRASYEMELREFYNRHLGLRPTPFASKMKERLKTGHDELIARGFLHDVRYAPMKTRKSEKVIYVFQADENLIAQENEGEAVAQNALEGPETPLKALLRPPGGQSATKTEIERQMRAIHISEPLVQILLDSVAIGDLQLQLDCLNDRKPKDPAATFVASVRGMWSPPATFLSRREAQVRQAASESARKTKAAQQREEKQRQVQHEAAEALENQALDAQFETLHARIQGSIETEIRERMQFVLNHLGEEAARNGFAATRRQIMREWAGQGKLSDEVDQELPGERVHFSKDSEADEFFEQLETERQNLVEDNVQNRLEGTGMGHLAVEHPARRNVRRNVLREMVKNRELE